MFKQLIKSRRNPQFVGQFVQIGRMLSPTTVTIRIGYMEYEEERANLSKETWWDCYGIKRAD